MTLIFSIHYFLWYGALTSIFGYEMVYSHHYTNSTTIQYGYLNMILPFITVITTPYICSMADRYRNHRSCFTLSLIFTMIALCLYASLPLIMDTPKNFNNNLNNNNIKRYFLNDDNNSKQSLIDIDNNITSSHLYSKEKTNSNSLYVGPFIYFCLTSLLCHLSMGVNNCLSDSFAVLQAEEMKISFGRLIVWGTFGWASSALTLCIINQWTLLPRLLPGILFGVLLLSIDIVIVSFWKKKSDFKLDLIPSSAAQTLTGSSSHSAYKDPSDYMPLNESAKINLGFSVNKQNNSKYRLTKTSLQVLNSSFINSDNNQAKKIIINSTANEIHSNQPINLINLQKKLSSQTIKVDNPLIEEINLPLGREENNLNIKDFKEKVSSENLSNSIKTIDSDFDGNETIKPQQLLEFARDDSDSSSGYSKFDKFYLNKRRPIGVDDSLIALAESKTETTQINNNNDNNNKVNKIKNPKEEEFSTSFRLQLILLGIILKKRRSFIRYLILFILAGFFMSMHWNYFFLFLEEIYTSKFEFISAFSMVSQSLLGELPFFILSRKFINFFGRSYTLSISIISIGIRFILYGFFLPNVNMYFIILCDCFQGPNYGLFYVIMTEVGLEYSFCDDDTIQLLADRGEIDKNNLLQVNIIRLSLRSTIQSVAFACYEGLGVGLGSLVGGWLVHTYGFHILWLTMAMASITIGSINIILELFWSDENNQQQQEIELDYLKNDIDKDNRRAIKENNIVWSYRNDGSNNSGGSQSNSMDAKKEFEEAFRKGTIQKVVHHQRTFPTPIPYSPFKFQQPPPIKLHLLAKKFAATRKE